MSGDAVAQYNSPPITEAVIGITFEKPLDPQKVISTSKKFNKHYPSNTQVNRLALNVDAAAPNKPTSAPTYGQKLASHDMTQVLLIWPETFTLSQLAPYSDWDIFFGRFVRDWKIWKRELKHKAITRIGVRYINRIDIPCDEPILNHEEFLNIYPKVPEFIPTLDAYSVSIAAKLQDIGCILRLNSAVVPSPLLGYVSIVLDQDVYIDSSPPQKDEDIFALLNKIRIQKNKIFESCISNKTRELFHK